MEVDGKWIRRTEGEVRDVIRCSNETQHTRAGGAREAQCRTEDGEMGENGKYRKLWEEIITGTTWGYLELTGATEEEIQDEVTPRYHAEQPVTFRCHITSKYRVYLCEIWTQFFYGGFRGLLENITALWKHKQPTDKHSVHHLKAWTTTLPRYGCSHKLIVWTRGALSRKSAETSMLTLEEMQRSKAKLGESDSRIGPARFERRKPWEVLFGGTRKVTGKVCMYNDEHYVA